MIGPKVLQGVNRAPSLRPPQTIDTHPIGEIIVAAGHPGNKYLEMDGSTVYRLTSYPRLAAMIDIGNILFDEYGTDFEYLDSAGYGLYAQVVSVIASLDAQTIGIIDGDSSDMALSTDGAQSFVRQPISGVGLPTYQKTPTFPVPHLLPTGTLIWFGGTSNSVARMAAPYDTTSSLSLIAGNQPKGIAANDDGSIVVAVGAVSPYINRSNDDGVTWSTSGVTAPAAAELYAIAWSGTHWVAVGNAKIWRSTDLASWSDVTPGAFPGSYTAGCVLVSNGNGAIVFRSGVGSSNQIYSTDHGATWSSVITQADATPAQEWNAITGNGLVWTGKHFWDFQNAKRSVDGVTWSDAPQPATPGGLANAGNIFCVPNKIIIGSRMVGNFTTSPRSELFILKFVRDKFTLIPPATDVTPAKYYVRAL